MSNSSNQTPILSNTAEIVENERRLSLTPLQSNDGVVWILGDNY